MLHGSTLCCWHVHMLTTLHIHSSWPGRDPASRWWSTPYSLKWAWTFIQCWWSVAGGEGLLAAYSHFLIWTGNKGGAPMQRKDSRLWLACYKCVRGIFLNDLLLLCLLELQSVSLLFNHDPVTFYITSIHDKVSFSPQHQLELHCSTSHWQQYWDGRDLLLRIPLYLSLYFHFLINSNTFWFVLEHSTIELQHQDIFVHKTLPACLDKATTMDLGCCVPTARVSHWSVWKSSLLCWNGSFNIWGSVCVTNLLQLWSYQLFLENSALLRLNTTFWTMDEFRYLSASCCSQWAELLLATRSVHYYFVLPGRDQFSRPATIASVEYSVFFMMWKIFANCFLMG